MIVALIDYAAGNRTSVERALAYLGVEFRIAAQPSDLEGADKIIFPGVGEARAAMEVLVERGLDKAIVSAAEASVPILGICIGCQVLLERSEERSTQCLGIFAGESKRFPSNSGVKVPQIGWNQVEHRGRHPLFDGVPERVSFFFDHSYYPVIRDSGLEIGATDYGLRFSSAFASGSVVAVQFHPEKSGKFGLKLLENFARWRSTPC